MPKRNSNKKEALDKHKKLGGKLSVEPKVRLRTRKDLSVYYTPGVGHVSLEIAKDKKKAKVLTIKKNTVLVVSDGSAVLGLGDIGPLGALPVMEGKAMILKEFAGVDAFPIVLDLPAPADTRERVIQAVETIKRIAPAFGGINLEDFSAPRCFEIEERLKKELSIPVMHDDQHGTAIVVLAGLLNAARVIEKDIKKLRIVIQGAGAAGTAIAKLLHRYGVQSITVLDSKGVIYTGRKGLNSYKKELALLTKTKYRTFEEAMDGADAVIGVSGPDSIKTRHVKSMAEKRIVFALANPIPEIDYVTAKEAGAYIIATGRSDFPNQINNALVFPGIFKGALMYNKRSVTEIMKIRAAEALARMVKRPARTRIIPGVFDIGAVMAIAQAMK
ncbi:NADP-dependent malic enzyme [Candidatus Kaiserbacteria bacterium]|nr:NADP-dependent malic enzyme [Candidatus Kaiserbacteria bacterium]